MEEWKDINENYKVSSKGRIYSEKTKKILKPNKVGKGYLKVDLYYGGKRIVKLIHRLVAEAFIKNNNPSINTEINHKDNDKTNNNIENLEWCDRSYNNRYSDIQKNITELKKKPVKQYTLDGKLIKIWPSIRECERNTEFQQSAISRCCAGKQGQHKGFKWSF